MPLLGLPCARRAGHHDSHRDRRGLLHDSESRRARKLR